MPGCSDIKKPDSLMLLVVKAARTPAMWNLNTVWYGFRHSEKELEMTR